MTASEVGHNILLAHVMQMLHYLVRFGYYNSTTDIKKLLKPLLDLLDGRNDKPLPRAATTDYDKVLQHYQTVDRYKKSRETKAVVDAKHQAMRVLDLFFNFRFNVRLKRFVAEFKDVQFMAQNTLSSAQDPLAGLLNENYDLNKSAGPGAHHGQVGRVHKMVDDESHVMRRLIGSKMTDSDVEKMCSILSKFSRVCHLEEEPEERHPMNQAILYNHGLLNDIFDLVSQDIDINLLVSRSSRFNLPYRIIKIELRCREMLYSKVLRVRSA
uniref:Sin3a_C domain-containing protein n=1 Tax=Macrostomum lignano TaxID=282301 RepID=A0A1I8GHK6_9PLAT